MSPEYQRIAIAETCGYERLTQYEAVWRYKGSKIYTVGNLPDYLNDPPRAMDKALADMTLNQRRWFCNHLRQICGNDGAIFATAAQRAEAFLRAVGKWQD